MSENGSAPIEVNKAVRATFNELGKTGLKHFSGTIYEEFLDKLVGQRGMKVYREMSENSAVISAMLFAVEKLLRSVDWHVEPVSEDEADLEAAEFLESCMDDMSHSWEDFISEVMSMLVFGWSYFEIVYKRRNGRGDGRRRVRAQSEHDDGRIGWRKFAIRAQDTLYRWEIDDTGGIKGMWQYPVPGTPYGPRDASVIFLPIEKCLLFRTTSTKNNPEGRSILRGAYRSWYFGKRAEEIEGIGMERDLAGVPVAEVPIELLAENRTAEQEQTYRYIKDVVTKLKVDEQSGVIWPKAVDPETGQDMYILRLMNSEGRRSYATGEIIQRYQQQILMTVMADFLVLGHENVGSFALSSDKTELFAVALGTWLDAIEATINRHAVPRLFELNDFDVDDLPQIVHGDIEKPDLQQLGDFVSKMAQAGAPLFPDTLLENTLREIAELPPVDPEERDRMMSQQAMAGGGLFGLGGPPGASASSPPPQPPGGPQLPSGQRALPPTAGVRPQQEPVVKGASLRPRYFTGSEWKTIYGRRRFLRGGRGR